MAPSGRRRAKSTKNPRRTQIKKLVDQSKRQEKSAISPVKKSIKVLKMIKKQEKSPISPMKNSGKVLKIIKKQEKSAVSPIKNSSNNVAGDFTSVVVDDSGCSTPKGKRFRIPEIVTCPPAPMRRRVDTNCSLRRSPISFFAPPDLDLFFVCALDRRDVSV